LGLIVSEEGIALDLEKVEAIESWLVPKSISKAISFMGLSDYYRRFIVGFSNIAHPITYL
jgi:hypothetical protein